MNFKKSVLICEILRLRSGQVLWPRNQKINYILRVLCDLCG